MFLADDVTAIDLQALGLCFTLPVKAAWAKVRECLLSCLRICKPRPADQKMRQLLGRYISAHRFAVSPLVPRVLRCFELPSGLAPSIRREVLQPLADEDA